MVTVGDYLSNPYGKGVSTFSLSSVRKEVQRSLAEDYPSPIQYTIYGSKKQDIIIHCKLPSRTKKNVFYDVVFQINISMANDKTRQTVARYPFKCFSNSPSFYYTFAKAFKEQDMICDWLWKKYERQVRWKDSKVRNPAHIVGYERTIYTCLYYIAHMLHNKSILDIYRDATLKSFSDIAKNVQDQDTVEEAYERAPFTDSYIRRKREAEEARRKKEEEARKEKVASRPKIPARTPHTTKTSTTKHTGTTSSIKKNSKTKSTPKTKKI